MSEGLALVKVSIELTHLFCGVRALCEGSSLWERHGVLQSLVSNFQPPEWWRIPAHCL